MFNPRNYYFLFFLSKHMFLAQNIFDGEFFENNLEINSESCISKI